MAFAVALGLSRRDSGAFFEYLATHPSAVKPVRAVFNLFGRHNDFERRYFRARLTAGRIDGRALKESVNRALNAIPKLNLASPQFSTNGTDGSMEEPDQ